MGRKQQKESSWHRAIELSRCAIVARRRRKRLDLKLCRKEEEEEEEKRPEAIHHSTLEEIQKETHYSERSLTDASYLHRHFYVLFSVSCGQFWDSFGSTRESTVSIYNT